MNSAGKYSENRGLLALAQSTDEAVAMEATSTLISSNMGLVRSIAMRFCGRGTEYEDLVQIGTIGMLKAIRSFDSERGTAFSTYAVPLIVGEIRRHLRDDGIIKISRCQRKLGMDLRAAEQRIMNEEGRTPHIEELATACGVSPEEAAVALEATTPILSLSTALNGEEGTELENYLPDAGEADEMEKLRDRIALGQAIHRLDPLWKKIVLLRYYRNLTQQETAARLGMSQVKISREEKKIVAHLRQMLA
ncbi:MAG: sigma-70 family RNA polymerase sigma factor [Clostridia bacterium]|nr:sigma-70 family RNA polymerase sigma factor [Clostridia bacterium]